MIMLTCCLFLFSRRNQQFPQIEELNPCYQPKQVGSLAKSGCIMKRGKSKKCQKKRTTAHSCGVQCCVVRELVDLNSMLFSHVQSV